MNGITMRDIRGVCSTRGTRDTCAIRLATFCVALVLALACVGCGSAPVGGATSSPAARYDGGEIAESEVSDYTADYRSSRGYDDDATWTEYLSGEGLTAKTWREQAIVTLVDERLMARKAAELGVSVDEERVSRQIEQDREASGTGDDESWARYLEARGTNPEKYRENLEKASIEQQVLLREVSLDALEDEDAIDSYIEKSLASRVARRYRALVFNTEEAAARAIADLAPLSGEALSQAFDGMLELDDSAETTLGNRGDIGWDMASDLGGMQNDLNEEMLGAGELSASPHDSGESFYVLLCTDRFEFHSDTRYGDLPDEELKAYVVQAANYRNWAELVDAYTAKLREEANVMVAPMPSGLPYDVEGQGRS